MSDKIPLPGDPRHQRIADLVLAGMKRCDAYGKLYPRSAKASRRTLAARCLKRPDVVAYMTAIRQAAADGQVLQTKEKREFLARVVRARIDQLEDNSDLWQELRQHETETSTQTIRKLPGKLEAIKLDNELDGTDPGTNALSQLASALAELK